jgi:hypothetical protein
MECTKFTRLGKIRNLKPDVQFKEMIKQAISFDDKISLAHVQAHTFMPGDKITK